VRLTTVPGTKTATIDEMIANCQEGVYVNRFSDLTLIDHPSGMMTGVTRDGCFFIKNGKIDKAIKNFRFTDSPFFAFNNVDLIGAPERVAFGNTAPLGASIWRRGWPRLPVIVPPMMIRDFNFSALASAV
jgi:predicted Zn-dependent protease